MNDFFLPFLSSLLLNHHLSRMKSQSKKTDINPRSYTGPWRFLIQTYLRNALCPVPSSRGVHLRDRLKEGFLVSHNGDRRFDCMQKGVKVLELDIWDFRTMVRRCKSQVI